ncbi:procathepsin L-like [Bolinopsis microptera]|uniref:procathepsin L-like n=1 Tax=Bolinopsis microptera TaxID=2820187 RepID=UPI0030796EEE
MILLISLLVAATCAHEDRLKAILRSPKATLRAYGQYKADQKLSFGPSEDRMRLKMWRSSAEIVAEQNSRQDSSVTLELNFFAVMTAEERNRYLGMNGTSGIKAKPRTLSSVLSDTPAEVDWTEKGLVTAIKDQASCGSCWTFGAVGGLETRYALLENSALRNFAEKEYLDCVYEGLADGCNGGWMQECYEYSAANGGRLAATADYLYQAVDEKCLGAEKPDAMIAAKIVGYVKVAENEMANIEAIAEGSITVAFEATKFFQLYQTGIIKDMTCTGSLNHAVTAVGYTEKYILVKNSWGGDWGESGYVRYMRGHHNCGLYLDSYYPDLEVTGVADSNPDEATDYVVPDNDDRFDPVLCKDKYMKCTLAHCKDITYAERYCAKTCNKCTEGGCPSGTILCSDDVCRHQHMCP